MYSLGLSLYEITFKYHLRIHFSLTIDFVKFLLNFGIFWRSESLHTRLSYEWLCPSSTPAENMGSSTSTVSPGEGTATGRLVWVTGKKGSVVFIVLCLREPPPHPSDLIWYHLLFSIPKVSEGFLSFFFLLKHMSLLMIIWKIGKSHSEPKGVPEG